MIFSGSVFNGLQDVRFVGVIDHGCSKLFYIDLAEYGKGANLGCSAILMAIMQHAQTVGFLPPILYIQSDNTSADYKNSVTFDVLGYLVSRGVFEEVRVVCSSFGT